MSILASARGLSFAYGGASAPALAGVDLDVAAGEVALIEGPSGGGKSTLLRALSGSVPHFHGGRFGGRVVVAGMDTMEAPAARVARAAGMVFQDPESQAVMGAVWRDVAFGPESAGHPARDIPARVEAALDAVGAGHLRDRRIATLSGGERQRVAVASVLACGPALLLLDEPTSQMDDDGAASLGIVVRALADGGAGVVIAEHRAERVRGLADRVWRVSGGLLAEGPGAAASGSRAPVVPGQVRLSMEGIRAGYDGRPVFADAGLELRAGEVTALRGANGSGKSLLARVAVGLHPPEAGRVLLDGEDVTALPAERRFPGVAMVPQDPGRHLLTERVDHEVAYALARLGVSEAESAARVAAALERFDLTGLAGRHPLDLSVGERERVALAALLVSEPGVLILDEPTRGMDPSRKAVLASVLADRAAAGAAVLLITHDAGFAATAADRILRIDLVARRA